MGTHPTRSGGRPGVDLEGALRREIRGEVRFDRVRRGIYATDASLYEILPVGVVLPRDAGDVRAAVRIAGEHGVPILPRGGGTALAGQSVGACLVLDFSKWMRRILEIRPEERRARVEPGVVRDQLNAALAPHRLHFAPDPATSNRATVGGMIGSNSSGTRSLLYGKTVDHVLEARVLLADGEILDLRELSPQEYRARAGRAGREAEILRGVRDIVERHREEIGRRFPRILRRVMGYNLDELAGTEHRNLARLFTGSEGTLGILLEATLRLEPLPAATSLCIPHFDDLLEAIRAVPAILEHHPCAVEILDRKLLDLALANPAVRPLCRFLEGRPAAVLIVEHSGATPEEAAERSARLARSLRDRGIGSAWPAIRDPARQGEVWAVRRDGLGILLRMHGARKPIPFIEDASVPVEHLARYVERVLGICRDLGVEVALYAHASVGVIHLRPILDLRRRDDIERMKKIAHEAFALVKGYGGCVSGEHGDGLVRSPFVEWFYGPEIYEAFREVKRLFDPRGLLNPGKIVDGEAMDRNLRYGETYRPLPIETAFAFREEGGGGGGFAAAVETCTGIGACRKIGDGVMCPSYMATRDEEHSTRGRANALRLAMTGRLGAQGVASPEVLELLDLCLACKACKSECPSRVDMARLKSEVLWQRHRRSGAGWRHRLAGAAPGLARLLSGRMAPAANFLLRSRPARRLLEAAVGLDRRRALPPFARDPLPRWLRRRARTHPGPQRAPAGDGGGDVRPRVVLFDDTWTRYHEPAVGRAAVALLEGCGYEVVAAQAGCCQRPRISHGLLDRARRDGERTLGRLDPFARAGLPILCLEPSCASALADDLPDLVRDTGLGRRVAARVRMIDTFLEEEIRKGRIAPRLVPAAGELLVHAHCHRKVLAGTGALVRLLGSLEGTRVREIPSGCCGMAGSFGHERGHYELSLRIGEDRLFPAVREAPPPPQAAVVACGFSCRRQIAHATGRRAIHFVQAVRPA